MAAALWAAVAVGVLLLSSACGSGDAQEATDAAKRASKAAQDAAASAQAVAAAVQKAAEANSGAGGETLAAAQKAAEAAQEAAAAAQKAAQTSSDSSEALAAAQKASKAAQEAAAAAQKAAEASSGAGSDALAAAQRASEAAQTAAAAAQEATQAIQDAASDSAMAMQSPGSLVVYSGRSESLVGPIIEQFREATGIDVQVKYGGTSAMAATLQEEGSNSPADVFWAQDPGALGALSPMFKPLPSDVTLAVPEWARDSDGRWVGVSGRARVIVYNTDLSENELPKSVQELTEPKWKGRIGWPPTNASFRVMVTAMRHLWGEDETREWLEGMLANDVKVFPKNTPIVDAAGKGEVDVGLVNHYYLHRFLAEHGDEFGARNLFLKDGGPGSLVMVAGAGILSTSPHPDNAEAFVRFLVSRVAQQYFAASTYEYPLIEGVKTHRLLPPLESLNGPGIDFALLDDLAGTETLLRDTGVIP